MFGFLSPKIDFFFFPDLPNLPDLPKFDLSFSFFLIVNGTEMERKWKTNKWILIKKYMDRKDFDSFVIYNVVGFDKNKINFIAEFKLHLGLYCDHRLEWDQYKDIVKFTNITSYYHFIRGLSDDYPNLYTRHFHEDPDADESMILNNVLYNLQFTFGVLRYSDLTKGMKKGLQKKCKMGNPKIAKTIVDFLNYLIDEISHEI